MTPLQTIYLGLAGALGLATAEGLISSGLLDTVEKARATTEQIDSINRRQIEEAAWVAFEVQQGRPAQSREELVKLGYLKQTEEGD